MVFDGADRPTRKALKRVIAPRGCDADLWTSHLNQICGCAGDMTKMGDRSYVLDSRHEDRRVCSTLGDVSC